MNAEHAGILTVGHGTLGSGAFRELLRGAHLEEIVDVRSFPGSRRYPHFGGEHMERWLTDGGIGYAWERDLGGFRKPFANSPNTVLRHPSFRGYADYMMEAEFSSALDRLVDRARQRRAGSVAIMCSESLWWRCHRRLIADALVLTRGVGVEHLMHSGSRTPHRLTEGVRKDESGGLRYDDDASAD